MVTAALLAASLGLPAAQADWIHLVDGQRWRGAVVERSDATVTIETELAGRIELPASSLLDVVADGADDLGGGTGEGVGAAPAVPAATTAHPPSTSPPVAIETAAAVTAAAAAAPPASPWSGYVDLSLDGASGSVDTLGLRVGAGAVRRTDGSLLTLDTAYSYQSQRGESSDDRLSVSARHDWLLPKLPWFFFTEARYEHDEFQAWGDRVAAHGGGGVDLAAASDLSIALRGGVGARYESSAPDSATGEGIAGVALRWSLTPRQTIEADIAAFPTLDDPSNWRTRSTGSWRYTLDERSSLSLVLGVEHEYDSSSNTSDRNDVRAYAGVRLGF